MLNITNHKGNVNENHSEVPLHAHLYNCDQKERQ